MSLNRTCNHDYLPDMDAIPGLPKSGGVYIIPNWNESFVGMTQCCTPNEVHVSGTDGFEGCVLWCSIPDEILKDKDGKMGEEDGVLRDMRNCVKNKGGVEGGYINGGRVRSGAVSSRMPLLKTTVLGVGVWGLVVLGLLG